MSLRDISEADFETEVKESTIPVIVDFWAEWCGPCKSLAPVLEELEKEVAGKVKIVKVNIDKNQTIASQHSIRSIPTLLLFDKGKVVSTKIGGLPKAKLIEWLQQLGLL